MKSFFKILLTLQLIFCFVSCSDFLDTTPTSVTPETYFNNKEEIKSFLTSVYAPMMAESFYGGSYAMSVA
jgi:ABC-type uncharacterized transport system YnjBCD permease subunit